MLGWKILYAIGRECEKLGQWKLAEFLYKGLLASTEKSNATINYRLGHLYFTHEKYGVAATYIDRALTIDSSQADWIYRLGFINERLRRYEDAERLYRASIKLAPGNSRWFYRLAKTQLALKNQVDAIESLKQASILEPSNRQYIDMMLSAMNIRNAKWETLSYLMSQHEIARDNPYWQYRIARLHDEMHQLEKAAENYRLANETSDEAWWHFHEGNCLKRLGLEDQAKKSFERAIRLDSQLNSQTFGIGAFYQKLGDWPAARSAYEDQLDIAGVSADLLYRAGLSYDRLFSWALAIEKYNKSVEIEPHVPNTHFRLGYCYERSEQLGSAISSYKNAIDAPGRTPGHYYYRLAYCLALTGEYETAAEVYLLNGPNFESVLSPKNELENTDLPVSAERPEQTLRPWHDFRESARSAASHSNWALAAELIKASTDRCPDFDASLYYEAGFYHLKSKSPVDACNYLRQTRAYQTASEMEQALSDKKHNIKRAKAYQAYRETLDIRKDYILYESHMGASVDCNPLAIFNEIQEDSDFSNFKHIWVASDESVVPSDVRENEKVIVVKKDSDLYRRYLASAEYLINNVTFQNYFVRRPEQKYLNTWHGTPIKTLGKDIRSGFLQHANVARNFLQATHLLTSNIHTSDTLTRQHDIDHILTAKIGLTGYPRTDMTVNASDKMKLSIKEKIGIPSHSKLPIVLYAPTWRGDTQSQHFDTEKLLADLEALNALNCHFVFRGHPLMEKALADLGTNYLSVPKSIDSNSLLSVVDVLVTDYSSIIFDFLPTTRPICLYAHDEAAYRAERGLYLELTDLPARVSKSIDELCADITASFTGSNVSKDVYAHAVEKYAPLDDGQASRRAVDFFFGDDLNHVLKLDSDNRKSLLFRASLIPNGVTSSFLNLVSQLDPTRYVVSVLVESSAFLNDIERIQKVSELPEHVRILGRIGGKVFSPEETWLDDVLVRTGNLHTPEQWAKYLNAYSREYNRVLGDAGFHSVIEFDGYSLFWSSLLASVSSDTSRSLVYQHSDMKREWLTRSGYLTPVFNLYRYFNRLVSVSETISTINRNSLSDEYQISADSFVSCNNQLDIPRILSQSREQLDEDIDHWLGGSGRVFCTIGRLSVEKNHRKLIEAFVQQLSTHPSSKLVIVGDGPLRNDLESLVDELDLSRSVLIAGARRNPFPTLMRSDLFLLSSDHEGQPMVLLEALVLSKPIISVDIPGAASILLETAGQLVENSAEGLTDGMNRFTVDTTSFVSFDADSYQNQAMHAFELLIS